MQRRSEPFTFWRLALLGFAGTILTTNLHAKDCKIEFRSQVQSVDSGWINSGNWRSTEYKNFSAWSYARYARHSEIMPTGVRSLLTKSESRSLPLDSLVAKDPADGSELNLHDLLFYRLNADAVIILSGNKVLFERYRGLARNDRPRLIEEITRPIYATLAVIADASGAVDLKAPVSTQLAETRNIKTLRKVRTQELADGRLRLDWTAEQIRQWNIARGIDRSDRGADKAVSGLIDWLSQESNWPVTVKDRTASPYRPTPEDDLLAQILARKSKKDLGRLFCDEIVTPAGMEDPVYWMTDPMGTPLSGGLGLSPKNLALFGRWLLDRNATQRKKVPPWFVEHISKPASGNGLKDSGLPAGSDFRYGYVQIGQNRPQFGIITTDGVALLMDVETRTVLALFSSERFLESPIHTETLHNVWSALLHSVTEINGRR